MQLLIPEKIWVVSVQVLGTSAGVLRKIFIHTYYLERAHL